MFKATSKIEDYSKILKQAQKRLQWATAYYLTELAWRDKEESDFVIRSTMQARDKRFISSRLIVKRASGRQPINSQVARAGSIAIQRFTGWKEQIEGGRKKRTAMVLSRTGRNKAGKMAARARLKAGRKFLTQYSIPIKAKDDINRVFIFLRIMSERKKEPFVLASGHPKLEPGLFTLEGSHGPGKWPQLRRLQEFGANEEIKKNDWRRRARDLVVRYAQAEKLWEECWKRAGVIKKKRA
jgi:hypothetical protein